MGYGLWVGNKGATATWLQASVRLARLRLVDELAGPSGNMGFGWAKQRNKQRNNVDTVPLYSPGLIIKFAFSPAPGLIIDFTAMYNHITIQCRVLL